MMEQMARFEVCWNMGIYTDEDCDSCPYAEKCSGKEDAEDEADS